MEKDPDTLTFIHSSRIIVAEKWYHFTPTSKITLYLLLITMTHYMYLYKLSLLLMLKSRTSFQLIYNLVPIVSNNFSITIIEE